MKMVEKEFSELVRLSKQDSNYMMQVLERVQPLIKSYAQKSFFLERQDAEQELCMAIIEAIQKMPKCETDGQCISYINNAVKFKFASLCKKNIKKEKIENPYKDAINEVVYYEKYYDVECLCDLQKRMDHMNEKEKNILRYLILEYSDNEIANIMGMSRQYINRIKKNYKYC